MENDNSIFVIVLHISEAVGLNINDENILLIASLGGNKVESEIVKSATSTIFENNLIWETDKASVKSLKTENLPIKVECYSIKPKNGRDVRTLIGYLLLPVRGVPIIPATRQPNTNPHWHKLIGLHNDWRSKKPEILLYLTITDKRNLNENGEIITNKQPDIESASSVIIEPCSTGEMLTSQQGLYIKLLQDEGLLQVGNIDTDCDVFILKLMFKNAKNLENTLNSSEPVNQIFRLHYNLLGSQNSCNLLSKGNGLFAIQEKIAINFRTTLISLKKYFEKILYIPIDLYYNDTVVGHARITLKNILNIVDLLEFLSVYRDRDNTMDHEGTFPIESLLEIPQTEEKPFVEYEFSLKYLSTTKLRNSEVILKEPEPEQQYTNNQGGGDIDSNVIELAPTLAPDIMNNTPDSLKVLSDSRLASIRSAFIRNDNEKIYTKPAKSEHFIPVKDEKTNIEALLMEKNDSRTIRDIPRTFSFNLILQNVKFTRRPEVGIWQVSLHHPKADTPFTLANVQLADVCSNLVEFQNLELQLFFASNTDEILNLIISEPCTININGPRGMHAIAELDNEMLLVGTKEKKSGIILMEDQSSEKIAMAQIFVYLDDLGINFNSRQIKRNSKMLPQPKPYMDEALAYKIVEELEDWKAKQREHFLIELKKKEINHLDQLSSEWQRKKLEQETKLAQKLEKCTMLTAALDEAHRTIKEKGMLYLDKEKCIEEAKTEFEAIYSEKLLELKDKAQRLEDDMTHRVKLEELKYRELEISKISVEQENLKLQSVIKDLEDKIEQIKRTYLPREQLAGLFHDLRIVNQRLDDTQKSKLFYKEQWAKYIREVHKTKIENLHLIDCDLRQSKCSGGIKDLLISEQNELLSEREELNFLKNALGSDDEESIGERNSFDRRHEIRT